MLTELLYENASARPEDLAIVYRDERVTNSDLVDRTERLAAGLAAQGIGAGDAVALLLPNDPSFVASYFAITGLGAVVVPVNPAVQAGRARLLLPPVRRPRGDQRRAHRRRLRADRVRLGAPRAGDHHQLGARPGAHARRADGGGGGEARAARARRAARLSVLLGVDRAPEAGGPNPRAVHGRGDATTRASASDPRTALLCHPALPHVRHGRLHDRRRPHGRDARDHGGPEPVHPQPRARARAARAGTRARSSPASRSTSG